MPIYFITIALVSLLDLIAFLLLFPTPVKEYVSKFIDLSDGANLIRLSFVLLAVNSLVLLCVFFKKVRRSIFDDQINLLVYVFLTAIVLYTLFGFYSVYELYISDIKV